MATCPECEGVGKWNEGGSRIFCKVCQGRGALNEIQLTGYQARKLAEMKLRLEELADPSPLNKARIKSLRQGLAELIAKRPREHQASSWKESREPRDQKIFLESKKRGVPIDVVAREWDEREPLKNDLIGVGFGVLVCGATTVLLKVWLPTSFATSLNAILAIGLGIYWLVLAFQYFTGKCK